MEELSFASVKHIHLEWICILTGFLQAILEKLKGNWKVESISETGTAMPQRFPNVGLKRDYELLWQGRGSYDSKVREGGDILIMKWEDNKCIRVASTHHETEPLNEVRRYSRSEKRFMNVLQPHIVKQYNENMNGVDLLNN